MNSKVAPGMQWVRLIVAGYSLRCAGAEWMTSEVGRRWSRSLRVTIEGKNTAKMGYNWVMKAVWSLKSGMIRSL